MEERKPTETRPSMEWFWQEYYMHYITGVGNPGPGVAQALLVFDLTNLEDQVLNLGKYRTDQLAQLVRRGAELEPNPAASAALQEEGCVPLV